MLRIHKDVSIRVFEVLTAWEKMRPQKQFYGLSLEAFKQTAKSFLDAREEIADLENRLAHAVSKRETAVRPLLDVVQGIVNSVKGDPTEGQNGELYAAMGYVPKNLQRAGRRSARKTEEGAT